MPVLVFVVIAKEALRSTGARLNIMILFASPLGKPFTFYGLPIPMLSPI
jgi:hypothetical protein